MDTRKHILSFCVVSALVGCGGGGGGSDSSDDRGVNNSGNLSEEIVGIYDVDELLPSYLKDNIYMSFDENGSSYFYIPKTVSDYNCYETEKAGEWEASDSDTIEFTWHDTGGVSRLDIEAIDSDSVSVLDTADRREYDFPRIDESADQLLACESVEDSIVGVYDYSARTDLEGALLTFQANGDYSIYEYGGDEFTEEQDCYQHVETGSWCAADDSACNDPVYAVTELGRDQVTFLDLDFSAEYTVERLSMDVSDINECD